MKKLFLSICFLLFANYLLAQGYWYGDYYGCRIEDNGEATVISVESNVRHLVIDDYIPGRTPQIPITKIDDMAFMSSDIESVTIGRNVRNIGWMAFNWCTDLEIVTFLGETAPTFDEASFSNTNITFVNVPIGSTGYEDLGDVIPGYNNIITTYQIKQGEVLALTTPLVLNDKTLLENNGVLVIAQGGELVPSNNNNLGIVEVETPSLPIGWHFIGAPFAGYALQSIVPRLDPSVCLFDYDTTNAWNDYWATINDSVSAGEGFFAYSWSNDKIIFTNYGDGVHSPNANSSYSSYNYDYSRTPDYHINTGDVNVTKTLGTDANNSHWMALANPYTFKLDVASFINTNLNLIRGRLLYILDGESYRTIDRGEIKVTEGFFVNIASSGEQIINFTPSQGSTSSAKASIEREFVRLAMLEGEREIELLFAQNEDANEGYDIFDANKLFSPYEIAEPYFVTNNIALVKEEVNTLPYYATMNVRSFENKEVKFKANYIPEGYAVSLIDGEETIDLNEGVEYVTNVMAGENADRFKVLIKKSLSIKDAEELQVNIYNDNRYVNIETSESDLQIEVYNALGQRVFATKDRNFVLNDVSAGAYLVKAFSKIASKSQKIVVR